MPHLSNRQRELVRRYQNLQTSEKTVLQALSLIYEPVNRTELNKCLSGSIFLTGPGGKSLTFQELGVLVRQLQELDLITPGQKLECTRPLLNIVSREAADEKFFPTLVKAIEQELPLFRYRHASYFNYPENFRRCVRQLRLAILARDVEKLNEHIQIGLKHFRQQLMSFELYHTTCREPFDLSWFSRLPTVIQAAALDIFVYADIHQLNPLDDYLEHLDSFRELDEPRNGPLLRDLLTTTLVLRGELDEAAAILEKDLDVSYAWVRKGWIALLRGEYTTAAKHYEKGRALLKTSTRKRKNIPYFYHFSGLFYPLALFRLRDVAAVPEVLQIVNQTEKDGNEYLEGYLSLKALAFARQNKMVEARALLAGVPGHHPIAPSYLVSSLATYWISPQSLKDRTSQLTALYEKARKNGYRWIAAELAGLLAAIPHQPAEYRRYHEETMAALSANSLTTLIRPEEEWERCLKALTLLGGKEKRAKPAEKETRLIWEVNFDNSNYYFQPKEQRRTKSGGWTSGRQVALKRLKTGELTCMAPQDRSIAETIRVEYYYYGRENLYFDTEKTLLAMVGHPLLFSAWSPNTPVELVKESPQLLVERSGQGYEIKFSVPIQESGVRIVKVGPTRYSLLEITEQHKQIADSLGNKAIRIPAHAREMLQQVIARLSSLVTVHSAIEGSETAIPAVDADARIHIHLLPVGDGFRLETFVRPFASAGPYFRPGAGGENIFAEIEGRRVQTRRDLAAEAAQARRVIEACPSLHNSADGSGEWMLTDPESCLQALLELEEIQEQITLEWPEGQKLQISHRASFEQLSLRIQQDNDWFALSGELKLDEKLVLDLRKLMELIEATPGRFVEIEAGQFIAITETLRKRIQELNAYSEPVKNGLRFHPLASLALQDFTDSAGEVQVDRHWKRLVKRLKARDDFQPQLPSTLQAELRDYQLKGFRWLAQLAHWGVGACLADDMGLGKTLQALAIILDRAKAGPTLVVAPASVTTNWIRETQRFAPTLNPLLFGGQKREELIEGLKPFDLLVCSYGLLPQEAELLSGLRWTTIVLDEAQAIKNAATQRSKTAMKLQGDFKLITTGTPIENHLGEFWNLFRFINPGLLGSRERFNEKYALPIEKYQDNEARKRLKKLIQPFILRRIKTEVLEELPPKTEITLSVELSAEEAAFYEALRQRALEKLDGSAAAAGEKHLQILAEIMRLRRACCHPRLVLKESPLESAKLNLLGEIVDELLESRHKALVFSQFVDHLAIVREFVESKGITYQYLDGSTPIKERQRRVDAFQGGEGELFLISLKAGGTGLNLTAADYVIHLDPWWNPAVEDQASDRTHRIGQQRPVTIYRLVTENTIEEKIVQLHARKRDLADSLLEGSDLGGRISAEDLLQLIREG